MAKKPGRKKLARKKPARKKSVTTPAPAIPERIVIPHDEYHGRWVGKTRSGHQFFITTPFVWGRESREFVALYLFDGQGNLVDAVIDDLGDRSDVVGKDAARLLPGNVARTNPTVEERVTRHLEYVGAHALQDISVKPFRLERHGVEFGLIPRTVEVGEGAWGGYVIIELEPGDYMAFYPPWDGTYDT